MASQPTPMTIRIYDQDNEYREFTRMFVPWKLLKLAVQISTNLNPQEMTTDDVDALTGLVVEVFGNQFSLEDLNEGADVSDMIAVLNTIVSKARGGIANPTPPG